MKHTPAVKFNARPAARARQTQIFFRSDTYSAFPHVIHLEGRELLIAFRQAPKEIKGIRHTHPKSAITVIRSYDKGESWAVNDATQLAAGGGQELGLIYLGKGKVGGALAAHEVAPDHEARRAGFPRTHKTDYPFRRVGALWCWSENHGLTWRIENTLLVGKGMQACAPPVQLSGGTLMIPAYGVVGRSQVSSAVLYRSDDDGAHWSDATIIARGRPGTRDYHEPVLMELQPGHLLCMLRIAPRDKGNRWLFWRNESFDNGVTWTKPRPTGILSGTCPRLLRLQDSRLLLTYGRRFEPYGIYGSISADNGLTWGDATWLIRKTANSDQGYTSSIQLDDGLIFTTCYARNRRGITGITGTFWSPP